MSIVYIVQSSLGCTDFLRARGVDGPVVFLDALDAYSSVIRTGTNQALQTEY